MKKKNKLITQHKENVIIAKRSFEAPRELVFNVYSDCKHLMKWYGGEEWPLSKCELDFREGGRWHYCFKTPDEESCGLAIYLEVSRQGKIVYKEHFLDEEGEINKEIPSGLISLVFTEEDGITTIINRWEYPTKTDMDLMLEMGAVEGLNEVWERLEQYLENFQS